VNAESIRRTTVHYSGHVQGVGFRYTVLELAKGFEVTGFVQNLADGRVLLVAEGGETEVDGFVAAVSDRLAGFIRKVEQQDTTGPRSHRGFTIR
jgi:acylphosphatase